MRFARRTNWELSPNAASRILADLRRRGDEVLDLTESNPTRCGLEYPGPVTAALSRPENLRYEPDPRGMRAAREAVAAYLDGRGAAIDPDRIVLTASTSEAYTMLFRLLAGPGDAALFPRPSYPLFPYLTDINDVELRAWPLSRRGRWTVDWEAAESLIDEACRAVVVVNPNNPTGSYLSPPDRDGLCALCTSRGIPFISDEVFWEYRLSGEVFPSLLAAGDTPGFVLGGLSKSLGLPQMKISWIVVTGPGRFAARALERLEVIADAALSVNTPAQNALPEWLGLAGTIQPQIRGRLTDNLNELRRAAAGLDGSELFEPEGGWSAPLRLPAGIDEEALVAALLQEERVVVHPGYFFDFAEDPVAVLSLLVTPAVFREGVSRLINRIRQM